MATERTANVVWHGDLINGGGTISLDHLLIGREF